MFLSRFVILNVVERTENHVKLVTDHFVENSVVFLTQVNSCHF